MVIAKTTSEITVPRINSAITQLTMMRRERLVADERYLVRVPDNLPLDAAAPLLCAGITVYSPLNYFELNNHGMHIGVVGLGGLGHVAVKCWKAFGVKVTVISTSPIKERSH